MAALDITERLRSWKILVKRFINDGQTSLFREKSIVREIRSIFIGKVSIYRICNIL